MKMDINDFKNTINKFATGVTIITGSFKGLPFGLTVNSFTSLSLKPTLILFNIDNLSTSLQYLLDTSNFNINILSTDQKKLSQVFASKNTEKFFGVDYFLSHNEIPIIQNSHAVLCCKKEKVIKAGDHHIFICEVVETNVNHDVKPLIFYNSQYEKI